MAIDSISSLPTSITPERQVNHALSPQKTQQVPETARPVGQANDTAQAGAQQAQEQQTVQRMQERQVQRSQEEAEVKRLQEEQSEDRQAAIPQNMSASELREMLDEINSALYSYNKALRFELHDKTEDLIVQVLNTKTDEIIRQYPSEEVLSRHERLMQGDTHFFSTEVS